MDKTPPSSISPRLRLECTRFYTRRLLPHTRPRRPLKAGPGGKNGKAGMSEAREAEREREEEPMDVMGFTQSVENVVGAWLNRRRDQMYEVGLVGLAAPFVWTLKTEAGMFFCFERLMTLRGECARTFLSWAADQS